jgi:membrane-bound metal-dependent hydrolase YbcI (DUF457 family)
MALLFAAPAWFVFDRITPSLAFTALAASTGMFPDVDLYLMRYFFIEHHGLTHSLVFTVPAALVLGGIVAGGYLAVRGGNRPSASAVYAFAVVALFTGMTAHLFADVLTSPDIAPPVKPLWPVLKARLVLDAAFVKSDLWNLGTLALGIVVQGGLGAKTYFGGNS